MYVSCVALLIQNTITEHALCIPVWFVLQKHPCTTTIIIITSIIQSQLWFIKYNYFGIF